VNSFRSEPSTAGPTLAAQPEQATSAVSLMSRSLRPSRGSMREKVWIIPSRHKTNYEYQRIDNFLLRAWRVAYIIYARQNSPC